MNAESDFVCQRLDRLKGRIWTGRILRHVTRAFNAMDGVMN